MTRWLPILLTLLACSSCYGTLDVGDDTLSDDSSELAAGDGPADTATPPPADTSSAPAPTTAAPPTTQTEPSPTTEQEPPAEEPPPDEEPEPALPEPGSIVEFQIAQGTGAQPWNTADDPVVVYVGQVLKVTNFDDRDHRMHATDDAAVPHGGRLQPGQSEEYVVDSPMAVGSEADLWDHDDGRSAAFWVEAREYPAP